MGGVRSALGGIADSSHVSKGPSVSFWPFLYKTASLVNRVGESCSLVGVMGNAPSGKSTEEGTLLNQIVLLDLNNFNRLGH